jgi:SAM-dependent methyltransferase
MSARAWGHGLFDAWRRRNPPLAARVRNTLELGPWYLARLQKRAAAADAYDTAFWDFHETGDWNGFARVITRLFPSVTSVVDIGCGQGAALAGLAAVAPHLSLRGFDDSPTAVARARSRQLEVGPLDLIALGSAQARAFARSSAPVDLAICLEVAEHLPPWHAAKLMDVLTAASALIFSAAHPNQGGTLHVNERPAAYWAERLAQHGFTPSTRDEVFRTAVAGLDLPYWYKDNVHVFEKTSS